MPPTSSPLRAKGPTTNADDIAHAIDSGKALLDDARAWGCFGLGRARHDTWAWRHGACEARLVAGVGRALFCGAVAVHLKARRITPREMGAFVMAAVEAGTTLRLLRAPTQTASLGSIGLPLFELADTHPRRWATVLAAVVRLESVRDRAVRVQLVNGAVTLAEDLRQRIDVLKGRGAPARVRSRTALFRPAPSMRRR